MIENRYLDPYYPGPILQNGTIDLINKICESCDTQFSANPPESESYGLSRILQGTPVYLATLEERNQKADAIFKRDTKFVERMKKEYEEKRKKLIEVGNERELEELYNQYRPWIDRDQEVHYPNILGWFEPSTLSVKICLEAIEETCAAKNYDLESLVCAITLHELAHALMYSSLHPNYLNICEKWLEESLANKVMLKYLDNFNNNYPSSFNWNDVVKFVSNQPEEYKLGKFLFENNGSDWYILQSKKWHIDPTNSRKWICYVTECQISGQCDRKKLKDSFESCFQSLLPSNIRSIADSIIDKVKRISDSNISNPYHGREPYLWENAIKEPFGLPTDPNLYMPVSKCKVEVLTTFGNVDCDLSLVHKNEDLIGDHNPYKVAGRRLYTRRNLGSKIDIDFKTVILHPEQVCSNSFNLISVFDSLIEAEACQKYLETKFVKFIFAYFNPKRFVTYKILRNYIPDMDFLFSIFGRGICNVSVKEFDQKLYNFFQLDQSEIDCIEATIQ